MFRTGNVFIDNSLTAVGFLPLLPVLLILVKRRYLKEQMNFLMIVCLLDFLNGALRQNSLLPVADRSVINSIFSLLELVFLVLLFRPALDGKTRNGVNIFLIAFLSVLITWFTLEGWGHSYVLLDTIEAAVIAGIILLSLPPLIRSVDVHIFQSSLVWIAGGTLFYLFTFILLEWVGGSCFLPASRSPDTDKMILLAIAGVVRYLLYTGAILVA